MEIPTSRGLFTPESISLHKDDQPITPGMIENIGAMLNPKETLLNYQHAQAAKTMANITLDGLLPEVKAKFGKEMNDYIQDYQDLLAKSSSVGGRIALNYGDRIKMEARQKEIQEKVDWAEQSVKDLGPTVTEFANKISGEGMRQFTDDWKDKVVNAKTAGDIPNPRMFIMQGGYEEKYPKTKPEDDDKIVKFLNEGQTGIYQNEKGEKVEGYDDVKLMKQIKSYAGTKDLPKSEQERYFNLAKDNWKNPEKPEKGLTDFNKAEIAHWNQERADKLKDKDEKKADLVFVDNPDIGGKTMSLEEIPSKWQGQYIYTDANGKKQTTAASGDITRVDVTPNAMTATINVKYTKPVLGDGTESNGGEDAKGKPLMKDGKPLTQTVEDTKQEPVTPTLISKLTKEGYNTDKLKKEFDDFQANQQKKTTESAGKPYLPMYEFKSTDPIYKSRLQKDKQYILDGQKVIWDGNNFNPVKK